MQPPELVRGQTSPLLIQAWAGVRQAASAQGVAAPDTPSFAGDRFAAFAAFRAAYVPLAALAADATKLRYAALRTMTASLHDCHTFFLVPVASDAINETREGKGSVGIGVELTIGPPPLVSEVIAGGPAARAGVAVGDRIVGVDDTDTTEYGPQSTFELINGHEGADVHLRLRRHGQGGAIDLTMPRERVVPQNIESRVINGGVGYLRIRNFVQGGVKGALRDALTAFDGQGVTKWIIDLRGNPGGFLDADALPVIRPTVLLTNNRTGSVAEVFAAALQEYHAAYVVGGTTNGCVGFTDIAALGDGSSVAVTTHVNLGPVSNEPLNGVGVAPDEPVARTQADIANGVDPQLDAAIAHLEGGG